MTDDKESDVTKDAVGVIKKNPHRERGQGDFWWLALLGDIPKIPESTLLKSCQLVGVFWGSWPCTPAENMANTPHAVDPGTKKDKSTPVDTVYPLEETPQAMEAMRSAK